MGRKRIGLKLQVVLNGIQVGLLSKSIPGGLEFNYRKEWVNTVDAMPVSQSLPLREQPYRGPEVEFFFDNLLPDNFEIRNRIAARMATESKGTIDLLAAIGRDCVGGLQFIPEGERIEEIGAISGEPLSAREISQILQNLKSAPFGLDRQKDFRISIAGVQEKTALLRWKDRWYRPHGPTPTSHILKPTIGKLPDGIDFSNSVENEWLCLKLAEYFGLPVAQVEMQNFNGVDCLVVERFDRRWSIDKKRLLRIPQEDLCQAMGLPWSKKYESDGGPGIVSIMEFLNASDYRDQDREQFFKTQLIFFLLGAIDGHAKNFSITLMPTGFQLTPIYDVMTIFPALAKHQIESKQAKLAMSVGDKKHYRLHEIFRRHWEQTAKRSGFSLQHLHAMIQDLFVRAEKLETLGNKLAKHVSASLLHSVMAGIKRQLKNLA